MSQRHRLAWIIVTGIVCATGIALAQDPAPAEAPPTAPKPAPTAQDPTPKAPSPTPKAQKEPKKIGGIAVEELEQVARFALRLAPGTRWQIERTLKAHRLYLVLSPPPPDLERQLFPYRGSSGLSVLVERQSETMATLRLEQRGEERGPLLSRISLRTSTQEGAPAEESLTEPDHQRGVIAEDSELLVHLGRLKRFSLEETFCRVVKMPLDPPVAPETEGLEVFKAAEVHFIAGRLQEALAGYQKVARPLKEVSSSEHMRATRAVHLDELAALRIGDVQACRGARRSALLRYEVLRKGHLASTVKLLAGFKWAQLAWPTLTPDVPRNMFGELPTEDGDPLVARVTLHAVRVMLQIGDARAALSRLGKLDASVMGWMDEGELMALKQQALLSTIDQLMEAKDDVGLVVTARRHRSIVWGHPQGKALVIEVAGALRRLGLPEQAQSWLQTAMGKLSDASDDVRLLGELARAYRESGDQYRGERTIRYLVERLKDDKGWLGRAEEVTISLAATEVALDARDWKAALGWLDRAVEVGGSPSIRALHAYVTGREALARDAREDAAQSLLKAASMRRHITPYRRAEVCLEAARIAAEVGRPQEAQALLRVFMEETQDVDVEIEVAFALAELLEAGGQQAHAEALFEDVALRQPEGTHGRLAAMRADAIAFRARHAALTEQETP